MISLAPYTTKTLTFSFVFFDNTIPLSLDFQMRHYWQI